MAEFLQNSGLQPMSLEAKTGIWARVNRNNHTEKSVIDYVLATPQVTKQRKNIIIDETGNLRMKGRKESNHNTIIMETKCQTRKALEKDGYGAQTMKKPGKISIKKCRTPRRSYKRL